MTNIIKANDDNIHEIVEQEILRLGVFADLNHIDVSEVTNMMSLFWGSEFNGDISKWDVSNVTDMSNMFEDSTFNGDISNWDVSSVENMSGMFFRSIFNGDISLCLMFHFERSPANSDSANILLISLTLLTSHRLISPLNLAP